MTNNEMLKATNGHDTDGPGVKKEVSVCQLASDHWEYVKSVLQAHNEADDVIEKCGHHYRSAFTHGHKHGKEDG